MNGSRHTGAFGGADDLLLDAHQIDHQRSASPEARLGSPVGMDHRSDPISGAAIEYAREAAAIRPIEATFPLRHTIRNVADIDSAVRERQRPFSGAPAFGEVTFVANSIGSDIDSGADNGAVPERSFVAGAARPGVDTRARPRPAPKLTGVGAAVGEVQGATALELSVPEFTFIAPPFRRNEHAGSGALAVFERAVVGASIGIGDCTLAVRNAPGKRPLVNSAAPDLYSARTGRGGGPDTGFGRRQGSLLNGRAVRRRWKRHTRLIVAARSRSRRRLIPRDLDALGRRDPSRT